MRSSLQSLKRQRTTAARRIGAIDAARRKASGTGYSCPKCLSRETSRTAVGQDPLEQALDFVGGLLKGPYSLKTWQCSQCGYVWAPTHGH